MELDLEATVDYSKALYSGISFPPRRDPKSGFFAISVNEDVVRESIYTILSTPKGSIEISPTFGSTIHAYLWEGITTTSQSVLCQQIKEDIESQEPRVKVKTVSAYSVNNTRIIIVEGSLTFSGSGFSFRFDFSA